MDVRNQTRKDLGEAPGLWSKMKSTAKGIFG